MPETQDTSRLEVGEQPANQKPVERPAEWEKRFAWICAEARLTDLQARAFRALVTDVSLSTLADEVYGPTPPGSVSKQPMKVQRKLLHQLAKQAEALQFATVQAVERVSKRFPESKQDAAAFARDVLFCARNGMSDWDYAPIHGADHIHFGEESRSALVDVADMLDEMGAAAAREVAVRRFAQRIPVAA